MPLPDIAATVRAFSRESVSATSPGPPFTPCSIARSSRWAGRTSTGMPAASKSARRTLLCEASTSGPSASQRDISRGLLPAPVRQQGHHRRRGLLDRAPRHVDDGPLVLGAKPSRKRDLLGHGLAIYIKIVIAMRIKTKQPVLADLPDAFGARRQANRQRRGQSFEIRWNRHVRDERDVRSLHPAV